MPGTRQEGQDEPSGKPQPRKPRVKSQDPGSESPEQLDERLDEELQETFPASDPLPWTHKSD
jgi:hypothetical protein